MTQSPESPAKKRQCLGVSAGRRRPTPACVHFQTMPVLPKVCFLRQIILFRIWFFLGKFDGIILFFSSNTDHLGKQFKIMLENHKCF